VKVQGLPKHGCGVSIVLDSDSHTAIAGILEKDVSVERGNCGRVVDKDKDKDG
jgi:hypothetical protein